MRKTGDMREIVPGSSARDTTVPAIMSDPEVRADRKLAREDPGA